MGSEASKANLSNLCEAETPRLSPPTRQEQSPVQCEDDPVPSNWLVIYGQEEFPQDSGHPVPGCRVSDLLVFASKANSVRAALLTSRPGSQDGSRQLGLISSKCHHAGEAEPVAEQEQYSVQCVDDPVPLNAMVLYGDELIPIINQPLEITNEGATHPGDGALSPASSAEQDQELKEESLMFTCCNWE